jgi:hypothetical protein
MEVVRWSDAPEDAKPGNIPEVRECVKRAEALMS